MFSQCDVLQRKFREADNEESYFDGDDDEAPSTDYRSNTGNVIQSHDNTSGLFSFAQTPMLRGGTITSFAGEQHTVQGKMEEKCYGS